MRTILKQIRERWPGPGAMGLVHRIINFHFEPRHLSEEVARAERHACNVDKQRRRLLARKLEVTAYYVTERARPLRTIPDQYEKARWLDNRAAMLRARAERLLGKL